VSSTMKKKIANWRSEYDQVK